MPVVVDMLMPDVDVYQTMCVGLELVAQAQPLSFIIALCVTQVIEWQSRVAKHKLRTDRIGDRLYLEFRGGLPL